MAAIVAFDLETTGLDPENDRIVEFCFIELDEDCNELSRWTQRVNPGVPIPPETTAVHGIRDEDVAHEAPFTEHCASIVELIDGAILMAYNHGFDVNVLHYELVRAGHAGIAMDHPVIDPLDIFRRFHSHSLAGAVKQYLDRDFEDAHAAQADTQAMIDVFRAQLDRHALPPATENLVQRRRRYLDRGRRFYEEDGVAYYGFGKHRDRPVKDHIDYAQWMLSRDFPEETKNVAKHLVDQAMAVPRQTALDT